jgi:hypothetical protein
MGRRIARSGGYQYRAPAEGFQHGLTGLADTTPLSVLMVVEMVGRRGGSQSASSSKGAAFVHCIPGHVAHGRSPSTRSPPGQSVGTRSRDSGLPRHSAESVSGLPWGYTDMVDPIWVLYRHVGTIWGLHRHDTNVGLTLGLCRHGRHYLVVVPTCRHYRGDIPTQRNVSTIWVLHRHVGTIWGLYRHNTMPQGPTNTGIMSALSWSCTDTTPCQHYRGVIPTWSALSGCYTDMSALSGGCTDMSAISGGLCRHVGTTWGLARHVGVTWVLRRQHFHDIKVFILVP